MSFAEILGRSGDEHAQGQRQHRRSAPRLSLFRRKRPFTISKGADDPDHLWDVVDLATGEQLGQVVSLSADGTGAYLVVRTWLIGKSRPAGERTFESVWAAADAIWKTAFPWKSRIWLAVSWVVSGTDYLVVLFRRATLLFLILLILISFPTLVQARGHIADRVLDWLAGDHVTEEVDDGGAESMNSEDSSPHGLDSPTTAWGSVAP